MLVLQRKISQSLIIGGNIKISIMEIGADKVRLAIDAPKEIPIIRAELVEAANINLESVDTDQQTISELKDMINKNLK